MDRLFTRAANELAGVPHMSEVRRSLLEDAAEFYEGFVQQKSDDPEIREEMGHAYQRLGSAYHEIGRDEKAVAATRNSIAIKEELVAEFPDRFDLKLSLQGSYLALAAWLGDVNYHGAPETMPPVVKAFEIAKELVRQRPNDPKTRLAYIRCHGGFITAMPTRTPEKEPHAREAITLWEQFRADFPDFKDLDLHEAGARHWIGAFFAKIGNSELAEALYRRSAELYTSAIQQSPGRGHTKSSFAHLETYYAEMLASQGRLAEAAEHGQHSIQLMQPLIDDFPGWPMYASNLLRYSSTQARVLITLGRLDEAEEVLLRIQQMIRRADKSPPEQSKDLAWETYNLGLAFHHLGRDEQAAESFREAFGGFERVLNESATESTAHRRVKNALRWTLVTCPLPQFRDAERSIAYSTELLQLEPLANDFVNSLGIGHYRAGNFADAIESLTKSTEIGDGGDISDCYFLAMAHWRSGAEGKAHEWYQQGVAKENAIAKGFDLDLANFRREAEKVLGIKAEAEDDQKDDTASPKAGTAPEDAEPEKNDN